LWSRSAYLLHSYLLHLGAVVGMNFWSVTAALNRPRAS
jgi:hypothetical protein